MTPEQRAAMEQAREALAAYMSATDEDEDAKAHSLMAAAFFKLKEVLANDALDKMAENARELGLEYVASSDTSKERVAKTPKKVHEKSVEWRRLTDEEIYALWNESAPSPNIFARAIEAKLKELNT